MQKIAVSQNIKFSRNADTRETNMGSVTYNTLYIHITLSNKFKLNSLHNNYGLGETSH